MERRQFLTYLGAVATAAGAAGGVEPRHDTDRDGLHDRAEATQLEDRLEAVYGRDQVADLDPDEPDLLIDVVYVDGSDELREDHTDWLETYFEDELGIHAQVLEREASLDAGTYERYDTTVEALIGEDGFYEDQLVTGLEDSMHQLLCIPDGSVKREDELSIDDEDSFAGYNLETRSVVADLGNDLYHFKTAVHELGHSLGLNHIPEEDAAEGRIMTDSAGYVDSLDQLHFTPAEQRTIRANLDAVL